MSALNAAILAIGLIASTSTAFAQSSGPDKLASLQHALLAYDAAPDARALERAAGALGASEALMALHGDDSRPDIVRVRALDGLGHFPGLKARGYLHRLVRAQDTPLAHRIHAGTALVFAYGAGALASVRPLVLDAKSDHTLRVALADALVRYAGNGGRALVREAAASGDRTLRRVLSPDEVATPSIR